MKAAKRVIEETYADYEKLVYHTVHRFVGKFGGDFDEYISEANLTFMNAFEKFDRGRGYKFSTYLVTAINNKLRSLRRADSNHAGRYNSLDVADDNGVSRAANVVYSGDSGYGFDDLAKDARTVLDLVLRAPAELRAATAFDGSAKEWKKALRGFLKFRGWDGERMDAAFEEIGEALAAA